MKGKTVYPLPLENNVSGRLKWVILQRKCFIYHSRDCLSLPNVTFRISSPIHLRYSWFHVFQSKRRKKNAFEKRNATRGEEKEKEKKKKKKPWARKRLKLVKNGRNFSKTKRCNLRLGRFIFILQQRFLTSFIHVFRTYLDL